MLNVVNIRSFIGSQLGAPDASDVAHNQVSSYSAAPLSHTLPTNQVPLVLLTISPHPLPPSFASSQYFAPFLHHSQVRVALLIAFKFDLTLRISKYPHPQVNHPQVRLTLPLNRVSKTFCTNI